MHDDLVKRLREQVEAQRIYAQSNADMPRADRAYRRMLLWAEAADILARGCHNCDRVIVGFRHPAGAPPAGAPIVRYDKCSEWSVPCEDIKVCGRWVGR